MMLERNFFRTADNTKIYYCRYLPENGYKAVVVFIHGIYETFDDYLFLAKRILKNNFAFISFDYRGFGKSGGLQGFVPSFKTWIEDLNTLFKLKLVPNNTPLYYLAYSMGSVIGLSHILYTNQDISGLVLSATGYDLSFTMLNLCRFAGFINKRLSGCYLKPPSFRKLLSSHKLPYSEWNRNSSGRLYPSVGEELLKCLKFVKKNINKMKSPVLIQHAEKDFIFRNTKKLFLKIKSDDKSYMKYQNCRHDLYKEILKIRKKAINDLIEWLNEHSLLT
jgi:acylglycerol lipase